MMVLLPLIAMMTAQQAVVHTLTLGEIAPLADGGGMVLAPRVLPAAIAGRVVEATVRRVWLPGQVWGLTFLDAPRPTGADTCERQSYRIQASAPQAPGGEAPADTVLTLGEVETDRGVAVLPSGVPASEANCRGAGYISLRYDPARRIASYRVLAAAMAAARRPNALPFAVTCRSEKPAACADARAALAGLPMAAIGGIGISCLEEEKVRRGGIISCPPLRAGQPYQAEVAFGMSGDDGQSWRVSFVHRSGWPETIAMRRTTIIYH